MSTIDEIVARIDNVLRDNKRTEYIFITLTIVLFLLGIACFISALITGNFIWSTPSLAATVLLKWPLGQIKDIRRKNIALAISPMLITQLPPEKAAGEIQKLLDRLFEDKASDRR